VKTKGLALLALVALVAGGSQHAVAQSPAQAATPDKFEAGKSYEVLSSPQPTGAAPGKVEVAEVFMYGCPHCFAFEPHIQAWLKKKADYVTFVRIPAPWNPTATLHARAFYTAEMLGKSGVIDEPFFNAFHNEHNYLDTADKLADFFAKFGVDRETLKNTFNSFGVDAKISRANDLITRYKVTGTPAIVVNGKYLTNGQMSGSYENWFAIIDELAAKEHAAAH